MADARLVAAALGAVTGVRGAAGMAALAHKDAGASLTERLIARGSTLIASGEVLADKAADLPARTEPVPLIGRAVLGALAAGLFARKHRVGIAEAAALGAVAAVATAFAATRLRRLITERTDIPDAAVGVVEDVLVLAGSTWIVKTSAARARRGRR